MWIATIASFVPQSLAAWLEPPSLPRQMVFDVGDPRTFAFDDAGVSKTFPNAMKSASNPAKTRCLEDMEYGWAFRNMTKTQVLSWAPITTPRSSLFGTIRGTG